MVSLQQNLRMDSWSDLYFQELFVEILIHFPNMTMQHWTMRYVHLDFSLSKPIGMKHVLLWTVILQVVETIFP